MSGILEGRKALVFGVANDRSIAWAVARELHAQGADLAFTYAGEVLEKRVRPLAEGIGSTLVLPCDVARDQEIEAVFDAVGRHWEGLDILVHAIAYAEKEDLSQPYLQTGRAGFHTALDISTYSLVALTRHAAKLMSAAPRARPASPFLAMGWPSTMVAAVMPSPGTPNRIDVMSPVVAVTAFEPRRNANAVVGSIL